MMRHQDSLHFLFKRSGDQGDHNSDICIGMTFLWWQKYHYNHTGSILTLNIIFPPRITLNEIGSNPKS